MVACPLLLHSRLQILAVADDLDFFRFVERNVDFLRVYVMGMGVFVLTKTLERVQESLLDVSIPRKSN